MREWFQPGKRRQEGQGGTEFKRRKKSPGEGGEEKSARVESILYVPFTPFSALKRRVQEIEKVWEPNKTNGKVRILERLGPNIRALLTNPHPWSGEHCGRQKCFPCSTKTGKCKQRNITYEIECVECKSAGKRAYTGVSPIGLYMIEVQSIWTI